MEKFLLNRYLAFFALCFFLNCGACIAQFRSNHWVFGDSVSVLFNGNAVPIVATLPAEVFEPSASISDANGNLLFYGVSRFSFANQCYNTFLYNKLGNLMFNSFGLFGFCSATQGLLILPTPQDSNLFYVFVNGIPSAGNPNKIYYNIIDMTLDGGNGGVLQSNVFLCDTIPSEQLSSVKHANGRDWWLIFHTWGSADYIKYLVTPNIILGPNVQSIGDSIKSGLSFIGEMVISEQGDKLCHVFGNGKIQLFDFDRCTGVLSNLIQLGTNDTIQGYYGASFSQSGQRLYVSTVGDSLFQFDLSSANIFASRQLVYLMTNAGVGFAQHQLAENGAIYISSIIYPGGIDTLMNYLNVINAPDSLGTSCDFLPFSFSLNGRNSHYGLPNEPNYNLGPVAGSICDSLTTAFNEVTANSIQLYPNPANDKIALIINEANYLNISISILNNYGQLVQQPIEDKMEKAIELNIDGLMPGYYYISVIANSFWRVMKFVKVN